MAEVQTVEVGEAAPVEPPSAAPRAARAVALPAVAVPVQGREWHSVVYPIKVSTRFCRTQYLEIIHKSAFSRLFLIPGVLKRAE